MKLTTHFLLFLGLSLSASNFAAFASDAEFETWLPPQTDDGEILPDDFVCPEGIELQSMSEGGATEEVSALDTLISLDAVNSPLCEKNEYQIIQMMIDGSPAPAEKPNHCTQVKVLCLTPEEIERKRPGSAASCRPYPKCEMVLTVEMCRLLNLSNGSSYPPKEILEKSMGFQSLNKASEVVLACIVAHESQHALDDPKALKCDLETKATNKELECLAKYYNQLCSGSHPMSNQECAALQAHICMTKGLNALHKCRCSAQANGDPAHKYGTPCLDCKDKCELAVIECLLTSGLSNPNSSGDWTQCVATPACNKGSLVYCGAP